MSFLKRLFGGGAAAKSEPEPTEYEGYLIYPEPIKDGNQFRISARIEKAVGDETKTHHLIRADTLADFDSAADASIGKARQLIDQQGDRLFD